MRKRLLIGLIAVALLGFAGCAENGREPDESGSGGTVSDAAENGNAAGTATPADTNDKYTKNY